MTKKVQGITLVVDVLKKANVPLSGLDISNEVLENTGLILTVQKVVMLSCKLRDAGLVKRTTQQNSAYFELVHMAEQELNEKLQEVISKTGEMELEVYEKLSNRMTANEPELSSLLSAFKRQDEAVKHYLESQEKNEKIFESFNEYRIKCPNCNSTNINKIGTVRRAVSIGVFGLASSSIGKTYKCNRCGYKW